MDSLPAEPPRKPKNTEVGNLFLLQQIFPTKESNQDLLHCRQILYKLSYQGSLEGITLMKPFPSPVGLPNPEIKPRSPAVQVDSLPAEPQRKPKNTGVGSLSLLQGIFLTQESNWRLLYCRWILYQLSHQGSPRILE